MSEVGFDVTRQLNKASLYSAGQSDLINTNIDVTTGANSKWHPVLRVRLDNIGTDELIIAYGSLEATNDTDHSVSVVTKLVVNSSYDDEPGDNGAFVIGGGGGPNVSESRHHELLIRPVFWNSDQFYGSRNITLMCRAVSSAAVSGDEINFTSADSDLRLIRFWDNT